MTNHHRASQRSGSPRSSAAYRRPRVRQSPSKPKPMRDLSASPREKHRPRVAVAGKETP